MLPEYEEEPHSYVKLWKHHAAQKHADRLNQIAEEEGEAFYSGTVEKFHQNG